ncbi:hypothetical protein AVEN_185199-1 [Araneus ventricosus]|uniref:Uncharacterized protein n=1 Tax=Araneus ventricosus TaxID=182803 RepID=A0A4Y2LES4_ARAVE|nr:hypothetical protein AVEN_185199-1 [Araneus ventricosus]
MTYKTRQAVEMRSDKGLQQALVDARGLCNSFEFESEFQEPEVRPQKKIEYDYEVIDEALPKKIQAKLLFYFFFFILDVKISCLQERSEEQGSHLYTLHPLNF